jgi:hypothetical protein
MDGDDGRWDEMMGRLDRGEVDVWWWSCEVEEVVGRVALWRDARDLRRRKDECGEWNKRRPVGQSAQEQGRMRRCVDEEGIS